MNFEKLLSKLFFLLIIIYLVQGWLYPAGGLFPKICLFCWIVVDIFYAIQYVFLNKYNKNCVGNIILVFWIFNAVYWVFSPKIIISSGMTFLSYENFKNITTAFLVYFPTYIWMKKNIITENYIKILGIVLFFVYIGQYIDKRNNMLIEYGEGTLNAAYTFVVVLPLLAIYLDKKIFYIFLVSSIYFVIMGAKRGALVCMVLECIIFIYYMFKSVPKNKKIISSLFLILMFILIVVFSVNLYLNNEYFQYRMELAAEGDLSARDEIYQSAYDVWRSSSMLNFLFGYGMSQSVFLLGSYAHNDWLELLLNQGLVGALIYLFLFIILFMNYIRNRQFLSVTYKAMYLSVVYVWLLKSLYSMGYNDQITFIYVIVLAIVQNKVDRVKIRGI